MVLEMDLLIAICVPHFASYVVLGRYLNFSVDQFPKVLNEDKDDTYLIIFKRLNKPYSVRTVPEIE